MSESPRWERESQEDLSAPAPQPAPVRAEPQETVEVDMAALLSADEISDPPEFRGDESPAATGDATTDEFEAVEPSPRLAAARASLATTTASSRESLAATGLTARESLSSAGARARGSLSEARESLSLTERAGSVATTSRKLGRWVASLDRRPEFDAHVRRDPVAELTAGTSAAATAPADAEPGLHDESARFPLATRGYERGAVDRHLAALEAELAQLRERPQAPMTITEEIERLGEQAASILVTAHDTASETARRAQEQAARAVTDAAHDAERITAEAERRLQALDAETDAIWQERERLLGDVREVSATLASLADSAGERFPGEPVTPDAGPAEPVADVEARAGAAELSSAVAE